MPRSISKSLKQDPTLRGVDPDTYKVPRQRSNSRRFGGAQVVAGTGNSRNKGDQQKSKRSSFS